MNKNKQTKTTVTLASGEPFTVTAPVTKQSVAQDWETFKKEVNKRLSFKFLQPMTLTWFRDSTGTIYVLDYEMKTKSVKCEQCGVEFEPENTVEEACAEYIDNFKEAPQEDSAIVCDPCYTEIMTRINAQRTNASI